MRPLVTIIIPFYNDTYVNQAVQSALSQSYSPIEIIVVDDGSTQFVERLTPFMPYIHYLGKANGGTASALNHGIRSASGEYIAWLSSDDIFYPDKINNQVLFMQQHNAWISHTNFNYINQYSMVTQYRAGVSFERMVDFYRCFLNANPVNGCTVMMRKQLFAYIGLFDERLPYTHDLEFWARAIQAGFPMPYLDEPLVAYRMHEGMGTIRHREAIQHEYAATQASVRTALAPIVAAMD
ncbi:glycosyltransferase involved in cell wall biosynthesis [Paenibacillus rhizosphaerae]|uniref:Glycosyltransferase involved in cell wall biosynthesis n=1 Tax=Paenibacillus rhizosphaerae TaxID=297318 RepID=A0A839TYK8_9BACL|nr:glycosyltransferase [Paenibacillus rhizosphaerae]MBB3131722.1 glycosyltransferase involved in cell wall biosynthesis [Paenibacillus rhizosphaerae]